MSGPAARYRLTPEDVFARGDDDRRFSLPQGLYDLWPAEAHPEGPSSCAWQLNRQQLKRRNQETYEHKRQ